MHIKFTPLIALCLIYGCSSPSPALLEYQRRTKEFGDPSYVGYSLQNGNWAVASSSAVREELQGKNAGLSDEVSFGRNYAESSRQTFYYFDRSEQIEFSAGKSPEYRPLDPKIKESMDKAKVDFQKVMEKAKPELDRQIEQSKQK